MSNHLLVIVLLVTVAMSSNSYANEPSECNKKIIIGYFNGVQTSFRSALESKIELEKIFGKSDPTHGIEMRYVTFYNDTDEYLGDFVEVFDQRLKEHSVDLENRFDLFFEALVGGGPLWDRVIESIPSAADVLESFSDYVRAAMIENFLEVLSDPSTHLTSQNHKDLLDTILSNGDAVLFIAHSQGNLFVNEAYSYMTDQSGSAQVVHIAPASIQLNGTHILADLDLVINGLRLFGSVPDITDEIPIVRPPGRNGQKDPNGHGLLEIYLNDQLNVSQTIQATVNSNIEYLANGIDRIKKQCDEGENDDPGLIFKDSKTCKRLRQDNR